jgi:hypothetical protein
MRNASPESATTVSAGGVLAAAVPQRWCLLTMWSTGPAGFAAGAQLLDGTARDFTSPFKLARFLSAPLTPATPLPGSPGLR